MKVKVNDAERETLNWMVAKCEGIEVVSLKEGRAIISDPTDDGALNEMPINYSTDWAQGGPIIEREGISLVYDVELCQEEGQEYYATSYAVESGEGRIYGPTPLVAAMRCFVAFKLGDEVKVPDELIKGESR